MQRRKLEDLNLLDNFLFGTMVSYPVIGERFLRELLRIIFQKEFDKLTVIPQKVYYGSGTDRHGARLDVYLEGVTPDEEETVYDIEPDKNDNSRDVAALPKRVRFYHAKIDAECLKAGLAYEFLKKVVIVMITPFDPFGLDRMVYTIRTGCEEEPDMPYDDGARTLFLYTKGTKGNPNEELRALLRYMEDTREECAVNESLRKIHDMVKEVKRDREVALEYMKVLSDEVEETIYLTVPMQRRIYYLEVIRPSQGRYLTGAMRAATDYMHVTSCGKAMMAYMPEGFLEKYFQKPVVAYTKNSITDIDALREELRRIRMRGYAIDNMENSEDIRCVGVPIKTRNGTVVGALSISGSPEKLTPERIDFLAKKMKEYAFHIEEVL